MIKKDAQVAEKSNYKSYKVVIIGAGTGGISVASKLCGKISPSEIVIIDAAKTHYYQPLWTLVGGGAAKREQTAKPQAELIPAGVEWIQKSCASIDPKSNTLTLEDGTNLSYEYLVVANGLRLGWEKIEGLGSNLGKNGICSIYEYDQVHIATKMIEEFKGGTAIFVMPPVPIKCAGAPQKIMYLADDIFNRNGVRSKSKVIFTTPGKAMFGVPVFAQALAKIVKNRNIDPLFSHKLASVKAAEKIAVFDVTNADGTVEKKEIKYDLLHVVPPMMAHSLISDSDLAFTEGDQKGWMAVDKHTLQSLKYNNIFGIGDVTGVPNSKTGAAIRKQSPVVVENLMQVMNGANPSAQYDGYSSCPLVTGFGKVVLAEFGYDGKLMPTFPFDQTKERRSMWILKRYLLPVLYWKGMMKGRA